MNCYNIPFVDYSSYLPDCMAVPAKSNMADALQWYIRTYGKMCVLRMDGGGEMIGTDEFSGVMSICTALEMHDCSSRGCLSMTLHGRL